MRVNIGALCRKDAENPNSACLAAFFVLLGLDQHVVSRMESVEVLVGVQVGPTEERE